MDDADGSGGEVLLATPPHLNVNRISRELRRTDLGLRNCLLSVEEDSQHVARLAELFPGLPVVANLRCGLWYAPEACTTAYFKVRLRVPAVTNEHAHLVSFRRTLLFS
jgi:hypothetical protein